MGTSTFTHWKSHSNSTILIKHKMKENEEWAEKKGENNTLCNSHSQAIMGFENYSTATPAKATGNLQVKFSAPSQSSPLKSEHTCSRTKQKEKERKGKEGEQMPERIPEQQNRKNTGKQPKKRWRDEINEKPQTEVLDPRSSPKTNQIKLSSLLPGADKTTQQGDFTTINPIIN